MIIQIFQKFRPCRLANTNV